MKKPMSKTSSIQVIVPDEVNQKMAAIVALSEAVRDLSKALNRVNVSVNISDCDISATGKPGIAIGTHET